MLRHRILCVGRRARDPLLQAADDYLQRIGRYARAELIRIRDSNVHDEGQQLLTRVHAGGHVVALDERGTQATSTELAGWLKEWQEKGQEHTAWIVGGADGLAPQVLKRSQTRLALSRFTLPHRLALVLLIEQLFRAHSMLRGEKYHRG